MKSGFAGSRPQRTSRAAVYPMTNSRVPRRRWRVAFLLALGVVIAFFDRINLSVSQDALHTSFGLSLIAFGYLSSAFSWTYAVMQMPAGVLLDLLGVRRVGRIGTFLWSIASFGAALWPGLGTFIAARFLLGVAESPTFPSNAKALGIRFPTGREVSQPPLPMRPRNFLRRSGVSFHRLAPAAFWLALELRGHRLLQPSVFCPVLRCLPQPKRGRGALGRGT